MTLNPPSPIKASSPGLRISLPDPAGIDCSDIAGTEAYANLLQAILCHGAQVSRHPHGSSGMGRRDLRSGQRNGLPPSLKAMNLAVSFLDRLEASLSSFIPDVHNLKPEFFHLKSLLDSFDLLHRILRASPATGILLPIYRRIASHRTTQDAGTLTIQAIDWLEANGAATPADLSFRRQTLSQWQKGLSASSINTDSPEQISRLNLLLTHCPSLTLLTKAINLIASLYGAEVSVPVLRALLSLLLRHRHLLTPYLDTEAAESTLQHLLINHPGNHPLDRQARLLQCMARRASVCGGDRETSAQKHLHGSYDL